MLEKEITTFTVQEKEIPVLCTLNVLEYIQEHYGNLYDYQLKILGLVETGKVLEDGNKETKSGYIDLKALLDGLTRMINEGLKVTEQSEWVTKEDVGILVTAAGLGINEAAGMVIDEMIKCITPKKEKAVQDKEKKERKSILHGFYTLGCRLGSRKKK